MMIWKKITGLFAAAVAASFCMTAGSEASVQKTEISQQETETLQQITEQSGETEQPVEMEQSGETEQYTQADPGSDVKVHRIRYAGRASR